MFISDFMFDNAGPDVLCSKKNHYNI